ncbi:hypothetical protein NKI12_03250 [Mesorhizobium australicum]|uniref:Uncharacterized protein n=1 Tax=Mesorhizobium australicum TaxID=536018 RepID=A0ACC6SUZ2_9HYPH|nr:MULTISPECIES: hypothetical protein [unclassified Mesorhizobium]ESY93219.1 hypothetical protein X741_14220 [Mesorhizobium sp. LNHC229A00]ESZ00858.1 hypothetical protein X738_06920 [Mesorhizobium sp. LNHC209A00]
MTHSTAVLFAHVGAWLLGLASDENAASEDSPHSPAPVHLRAGRDRLPPRDESFYWAWQYWSQ